MIKRVNQTDFSTEVLQAEIPVLVEFYSDSCIPCKQMSPILTRLEEEFHEHIKIVKVNVNFDIDLAEQYGVMGSPSFLVFVKGKVIKHRHGLKREDEIRGWIKEVYGSC